MSLCNDETFPCWDSNPGIQYHCSSCSKLAVYLGIYNVVSSNPIYLGTCLPMDIYVLLSLCAPLLNGVLLKSQKVIIEMNSRKN